MRSAASIGANADGLQEGIEIYSQAYAPWSKTRQMVLNAFPTVSVPRSSSDSYIFFFRDEIMKSLGSSMRTSVDGLFVLSVVLAQALTDVATVVSFGKKKPMAIKHALGGCIFADGRNINPWLPSRPGQHGYMFFGVKGRTKDNTKFLNPTTRALFVPENRGEWRYYGLYVVHRQPANDLTKDEWLALSDAVSWHNISIRSDQRTNLHLVQRW